MSHYPTAPPLSPTASRLLTPTTPSTPRSAGTNQEVVAFLRQFMGRQFVHMHAITDAVGPGDAVATWEQPPAGPW